MAEDTAPKASGSKESGKTMAALAYIIFFLPMLTNPRNDFAMYHAKQSLVLLIADIIAYMALMVITIVTLGIGAILYPILMLATLIYVVLGIMNALNGKEQPLPLIGKFASNFKF